MKNFEIFESRKTLDRFSDVTNKSFSYAVYKNMLELDKEIEIIKNISKDSDEYLKYDKERQDICYKYCEKDINNNPLTIITNGKQSFKILDKDKETFDIEMDELKIRCSQIINEKIESVKSLQELMNKESNVKLTKISFNDLPEKCTTNDIKSLSFMLD